MGLVVLNLERDHHRVGNSVAFSGLEKAIRRADD